jgi:diguanylate cyclase
MRRPASIQGQITRFGLWWTGATLLGFALVVSLHEAFTRHQMLLDSLRAQARLIGGNSTAAVMFDNRDDADEILASLRETPDILHAVILRADGRLLADFSRTGAAPCHSLIDFQLQDLVVSTRPCGIALAEPIVLNGDRVGLLVLETGLQSTWRNLVATLLAGMILAVLAFALSVPVWRRLARRVATPLSSLVDVTRRVRDAHDFSQRATVGGSTEVRELAGSFNELMGELQLSSQQVQHELARRREAESRLSELAYADSVTLVPNRHYFTERLDQMVHTAGAGLQPFGLLYLDLDGFKAVNDTLGHDRGDELLRKVAGRMRATLRSADVLCRLGGDEFAVILPEVIAGDDARTVAHALLEAVSQPYDLHGDHALISVSIGGCLCPGDAVDRPSLMRHADMAMYRAKALGKRRFCLYTADMDP